MTCCRLTYQFSSVVGTMYTNTRHHFTVITQLYNEKSSLPTHTVIALSVHHLYLFTSFAIFVRVRVVYQESLHQCSICTTSTYRKVRSTLQNILVVYVVITCTHKLPSIPCALIFVNTNTTTNTTSLLHTL